MKTENPRDRSVEHLLRTTLRGGAGAPSQDTCLDAETLAAWVDGGLDAAALALAIAHASSCARCQALVGAMARTTPDVPLPVPWWRREWSLRWLVPMTAGVAALALWIMIPTDRLTAPPPREEVAQSAANAVAEKREAAPLSSDAFSPRREPAAGLRAPAAPPSASIGAAPRPSADAAAAAPETRMRADSPTAKAEPKFADERIARDRESERREKAVESAVPPAAAPPPPAPMPIPQAAAQAPIAAAAPSPAPPPARAASPSAPPPPAAETAAGAGAGARAGVAGAVTAAPSPTFRSNTAEADTKAVARQAFAPVVIASPDTVIRWRLAPGGSVHYSSDGGRTWEALSTGVSTDLTAGSSPSAAVCWIVGRRGVVLLTTDGRRLQQVPFLETTDLVGVQATDARTSVVTTLDGRTFRTTDGGLTWSRLAP